MSSDMKCSVQLAGFELWVGTRLRGRGRKPGFRTSWMEICESEGRNPNPNME